MRRPIAKINIWVHYINNISNTLSITYYLFKVILRNMIQTQSKQTATFIDSII